MATKAKETLVENLIKSLRNVAQIDIGWRGHYIKSTDDVRDSINDLIHVLQHTNWETNEKARRELQRGIYSLKAALQHESDLDDYLETRANCKMRKTINYRLNLILEILDQTNRYRKDVVELDDLLDQLIEIRRENLAMLDECEKCKEQWENKQELNKKFARSSYYKAISEGKEISARRRYQLDKIEEQKEQASHRMLILLTQSLLGNAYEFVDRNGHSVLEYSIEELSPDYQHALQSILHNNYRNATTEEVKEIAYKAIHLIRKGFDQMDWDIPAHINEQIEELNEALSENE